MVLEPKYRGFFLDIYVKYTLQYKSIYGFNPAYSVRYRPWGLYEFRVVPRAFVPLLCKVI